MGILEDKVLYFREAYASPSNKIRLSARKASLPKGSQGHLTPPGRLTALARSLHTGWPAHKANVRRTVSIGRDIDI